MNKGKWGNKAISFFGLFFGGFGNIASKQRNFCIVLEQVGGLKAKVYVAVLSACAHVGLLVRALASRYLKAETKEYGLAPGAKHHVLGEGILEELFLK